MSGSRKSLQRAAQTFNPRAENWWSKDDSKFGQRMLEKMGWKKGEGVGREGQGVTENIKIRWKLDSKGLGFSIKEDEWVAVEHDFSKLLSNLNKNGSKKSTKKLSLESTSSSSRSRVHYRKFIRGKDISKYSKKDLSGILGRNAEVSDEDDCENGDHMDESSAERVEFSFEDVSNNSIDDSSKKKLKKRKLNSPDPLHVSDDDLENCGTNADQNDTENNSVSSVGVDISLDTDVSSSTKKVKKRKLNSESRNNAENGCAEPDPSELTDFISSQMENSSSKKVKKKKVLFNEDKLNGNVECDLKDSSEPIRKRKKKSVINLCSDSEPDSELRDPNIASETDNSSAKKVKKKKLKRVSNLNQIPLVNEDEQNENRIECDLKIDSSAPMKKCKKKSVIDLCSDSEPDSPELRDSVASETNNSSAKKEVKKKKGKRECIIEIDDSEPIRNCENESKIDLCSESEADSSELRDLNAPDDSSAKKEVKKKKVKRDSNQTLLVNEDEQNQNSVDLEIDNSAPTKKRKKKSVTDSCSELAVNGCEEENQPTVELENSLIPECSSARKRRKEKNGLSIDDFDCFMQKVTEFNASTDPKAVIEEFEKNKEALLKRYRDSYLRNYLESANENDSRIYCDLNGDELDCENGADDGDSSKKMKKGAHLRARPLTKAERIVLKARLLKTIQNKSLSHKFAGSNLNDIVGYGNVTVSS